MSATDTYPAGHDEPLHAEVVDRPDPPPAPEPADALERANAVIDAAANAAASMPGVPGRDEFLSLAMQARILSTSAAAPKAVRNNPALAFHVAMVGRDLGISPSAALELIDIIETKRGSGEFQLSLSPQLLNAQVRRLGLGEIVPAKRTNEVAVAVVVGPGGLDPRCRRLPFRGDGRFDHVEGCACDILGDSEFSWEDARTAGLVGKTCKPGDHKRNSEGKCGCNSGYQTYPKRMLWWRAGGFAADDYFPEAGLGLYSPEELGAVVDEGGRPIDPTTVELPPGYEQRQVGSGGGRQGGQDAGDPGPVADATKLADLVLRIRSLPPDLQDDLKSRWGKSNLAGFAAAKLPESKYGLANSMVLGYEARARAAGVDLAGARQQVEADLAAQEEARAAAAAAEASQDPDGAGKTAGQVGGRDKMSGGEEAGSCGSPTATAAAAGSTGAGPKGGASPAGSTSPPPVPSPDAAAGGRPGSEPGPPPTAGTPAPSPSGGSTATDPATPVGGVHLGFNVDLKAVFNAATEDLGRAATERANAVAASDVNGELERLGQPTVGGVKERRRRLVAAYLLEAGVRPANEPAATEGPQ